MSKSIPGAKEETKQLTVVNAANENAIQAWSMPQTELKQIFGPDLTPNEFSVFLGLGKALGANPFLREIWAIKYNSSKPASIFLGRDFYRRKVQEQSNYIDHKVRPMFTNDILEMDGDRVAKHQHNLKDRGQLLGAYCQLITRDADGQVRYRIHTVFFEEYAQTKDEYVGGQRTGRKVLTEIWAGKPIMMICKVAEAQGIRMYYQALFAGTYDESEAWYEASKAKEAADVAFNALPPQQPVQQVAQATNPQQTQYAYQAPVVEAPEVHPEESAVVNAEFEAIPENPIQPELFQPPVQPAVIPTTGVPSRDESLKRVMDIKTKAGYVNLTGDQAAQTSLNEQFRLKCIEITGNPNLTMKTMTDGELNAFVNQIEVALTNTAKPAVPQFDPNNPYAQKF